MERVASGIPGLDELMEGGFPKGRITLLSGTPGSGKTTLGMQFLVEGIKLGENGLLVTLAEFPEDIILNMSKFGWNLEKLMKENKIKIINAAPVSVEEGRDEYILPIFTPVGRPKFSATMLLEIIKKYVEQIDAKRVVIDSITYFELLPKSEMKIRQSIHELIAGLANLKCTTLLIGESKIGEYTHEEYLAHGVLELQLSPNARDVRKMRIVKMRGTKHPLDVLPFKITNNGIKVFPKLRAEPTKDLPRKRVKSGIEGLDRMLGGGFWSGYSAVVTGPTGVGKTVLGLQFIVTGAMNNEPGLIVIFEETPNKLLKNVSGFGWNLEELEKKGLLKILYSSPTDLCIEELALKIKEIAEATGIKRVLIDGLTGLPLALQDPDKLKDYIHSLCMLFESHNITSIFTIDTPQIIGPIGTTDVGASIIVDAVILLRFAEIESKIKRVMAIPKMKGSNYDTEVREFEITPKGIIVTSS
ncbi:MAG: hypothetical protein HY929_08570 [Euryarchaeota archaeon]|nr:hypothetical protein [Euryarchaeota archaeon]